MDTTNNTGNIDNNLNTTTEGASPKSGKGRKPTKEAAPQVAVPAGFIAGAVQRVEPSGTSTVPAGDYVVYTTKNAAGKEVKRIIHEGRISVIKRIGGRLVACKDFEKTGLHVGKSKGEKVRVDLGGLREALAAFQAAGGNPEAELTTLTASLVQRTAALTAQKAAMATIQAQVAERVAAALAAGQDMSAILAALTPPVTDQPST